MQSPAEFSRDHQPAYMPTTNRPLAGLLTVGVYALVLVVASHRAPNRAAPSDLAARMESERLQETGRAEQTAPQTQPSNAPQDARRNAAPPPHRQQLAASRQPSFLERLFGQLDQRAAPVPGIAPAPGPDGRSAAKPAERLADAQPAPAAQPSSSRDGNVPAGGGAASGQQKTATETRPPACYDAAWAQAITDHLRRFYPAAPRGQRPTGVAMAHLVIRRSGWLNELEIARTSGNAALDAAAYVMVRKAQPLPRIPDRIAADRIDLQLPIAFGAGGDSKITMNCDR